MSRKDIVVALGISVGAVVGMVAGGIGVLVLITYLSPVIEVVLHWGLRLALLGVLLWFAAIVFLLISGHVLKARD